MGRNSRPGPFVLAVAMAFCLAAGVSLAQQSDDMSNMPGMDMSSGQKGEAAAGKASGKIGSLDLSDGFVRAMLPGQPVGGGYVTIHNGGSADDRLVSVTSPAAAQVELHEMSMKGDVMTMRQLKDGIRLPAGATVTLSPNTLHMMFKKVASPFKQGGSIAVRLSFEKAGMLDMNLPVASPQAK